MMADFNLALSNSKDPNLVPSPIPSFWMPQLTVRLHEGLQNIMVSTSVSQVTEMKTKVGR